MVDVSVVVPTRNAEDILGDCLDSIAASEPREIIVVDGVSTDGTTEVARRVTPNVISDEGRGLPAARALGARAARSRTVALVDADVRLPDGALEQLVAEFDEGGYTALQAGLRSTSGDGYWGRALVNHHMSGRSKNWFGLVATAFDREALLSYGFDPKFLSGEDIEIRWRLQRDGARIGVSKRTVVMHRFEDTWEFAKGQWLADGRGLARMISKHRWRAAGLLALPALAAARGIGLSLVRLQPQWIPYYACYLVFNYVGMSEEVGERGWRRGRAAAR